MKQNFGQNNFFVGAQKFDIEPSGNAVHVGCESCCELEWYFNALELDVANGTKIKSVSNRTVDQKRRVKRINNRLREIGL